MPTNLTYLLQQNADPNPTGNKIATQRQLMNVTSQKYTNTRLTEKTSESIATGSES
jgi:hypothetical protein